MEILMVLLGYIVLTSIVHGQDQSGFISIDCGTNPGSSYFDAITEIYYVSDSEFIDTGKNYDVSEEHSLEFKTANQQLMNVRSFPEGVMNCYTLPPQQGKDQKYLIRASFMYGNYDSKNQLPAFKLYLGVDEWDTVKFDNPYDVVTMEIIHVPKTDDIYVCLVNTGSGSPFISALELRLLNSSIYTTKSGSLILLRRLDVGSTRNQTVRYKDDAFDRLWEPFSNPYWKSVSAAYGGDTSSDNHFKPPAKVMETAVTPADERDPLEFHLNLDNSTRQFYVYLHFSEVEDLQSNQLREFYVSLNGWFWSPEPIVPGRSVPHTVFSTNSISASSELSLSIYKTHLSTLPPILNALEIYEIKQMFHLSTVKSDVDAIKKIKMAYKVKKNWQGDPCLPIEFSWDGLTCSYSDSISPTIISLNISCSKLNGEIDSSFFKLTSLKYLDLSYNSLTGEVPNFLSKLPSLKTLNLSGNNLTGSLPLALLEKSKKGSLSLRLDGNPNLCKKPFCEDQDEEEEDKEKMNNNAIIPVVASIISVLIVLLGEWIFKWRTRHVALDSQNRQISLSEVDRITANLKKMLYQGASGKVYLGHLSDGTEVAVKMLRPSSVLLFKQLKTEVELLAKIHHKNLVSLIAYCDEGSSMMLVYEHTAKANLKEHLSGEKVLVLSWEQRLRIAIDVARALDYLHDGCNPAIIHGDVKTENILLNEKFEAKVANFGWPRSLPSEGGSYISNAIVGTPGYVDPEYNRTSVPSKKTDVYSFGIVLLELISGQPAIINITEDSRCNIADWAHLVTAKGDIEIIIDPRLQGEFEATSPQKAVKTAMSCVSLSSTDRPTMSQIVTQLNKCLELAIAHERTDNAEENRDLVHMVAAHERTNAVEEDYDVVVSEAACERTDDAEVGNGPYTVESAHKRNESGEEAQVLIGIGAALERHDNGKENHSHVGIATAYEIADDAEEEQGPVGRDTTKESTHKIDEDHGAGVEVTHERNNNGEKDHGPFSIEAAHDRTSNLEEDHGCFHIQAAMDIQESKNLYEAEEMKEKKKNVAAVASNISVVIPIGNVVKHNEGDNTFEPRNQYFSYSEVETITDNFRMELGRGASAAVYHGHLSNGTEVAVKKLSPSSTLGLKQFRTEAQLLTRIHHKNLVSLYGYCDEGSNMVLIYEYMAMGNLKAYLSGNREAGLNWEQRLQIAIDAAQALEYLHNGCNPPIIHRDVKTENILLNKKLQAKMADFGWSKSMAAEDGSFVSTAIVGTVGYLDPEYHRNSVPNEKTDVYSFGIVLLELISSRPAVIKNKEGIPCNISDWARSIIANRDIIKIVDPGLQGAFEINSARRAIKTAMSCVSFSSTDRPTMRDVVAELRICLKIAMAHGRTYNFGEGQASVHIEAAFSVQESLGKTGINRKAAEREEEKKKKKKKNFIRPAVASITSALVPSGALTSLGKSKKKWPQGKDKSAHNFQGITSIPHTFQEVASITRNFKHRIGGKFEKMYLGHLIDGTEVAVKSFPCEDGGFKIFQTEAEVFSKVNHKNLDSLLGYCSEGSNLVLIYEHMVNGSLKKYLFDKNEGVLSWKQRIGIALDVAQGLEYLHNDCRPSIIYRDVKSSNILLNNKLQAKLAGSGFVKIVPDEDADNLSTVVYGTDGYIDFEYLRTGRPSVKSDVYSFGIVLLELVSGQPAVTRHDEGTILLSKWVKSKLNGDRGEIRGVVDPRLLNGDYNISSAQKVVETAMACVRPSPSKRPNMSIVAYILKECVYYLARPTGDLELDLGSLLGAPEEEAGSLPFSESDIGSQTDHLEQNPGSFTSEDSVVLE